MLFEIGQRYGASDTLRHAFFAAINTMASSTERKRVLLALIGRASRSYRHLATAGLVLSCVGAGLVAAYIVLGLLVSAVVPIHFPIRPRRL